jgi:ribosomal protein S18 acetylase RimI-like enzyme
MESLKNLNIGVRLIESEEDMLFCLECMFEIEKFHLSFDVFLKKSKNKKLNKEYFIDNNIKTFLIIGNGQYIGFYRILINLTPDFTKDSLIFIDPIYILEKFRFQGIGKLIINEIENCCKELNVNSIMLNVWTFNNSAVRFYHSIGFNSIRNTMIKKINNE